MLKNKKIPGKQKIFGIGLSKTATMSLTVAIRKLGYKAKHMPYFMMKYNKHEGRLNFDIKKAAKFDCLTDTPVARFYKELDKKFPGSKFILTTRDLESWLKSCKKHPWPGRWFKGNNTYNKLHSDLYGAIKYDEAAFTEAYKKFHKDVFDYFKGREEDLLVLDVKRDNAWKKICDFLGEERPKQPFPRINVAKNNLKIVLNTFALFWESII